METDPRMANRLELWPRSELVPYQGNAKVHPRAQLERLAASIKRHGFLSPVVVNEETKTILAGHARVQAAELLGLDEVPVVPVAHLTEDEQAAFVIADNRLGDLGEWDLDQLAAELGKLEESLGDSWTAATGFDDAEFREILRGLEGEPATAPINRAKSSDHERQFTLPDDPVSRLGDVWVVGDSRIACADSFESLEGLLAGELADMTLTDPPYAILGSTTGVTSDTADDKMVRPFFKALHRATARSLKPFGHGYVFTDWRSYSALWESSRSTGMSVANAVVWNKEGGGSGLGSTFGNVYELVAFMRRAPKQRAHFETTVAGHRDVFHANVLSYPRPGAGGSWEKENERSTKYHAAQKPVDLLSKLIELSSDEGELVVDLCAGSGSTLVAAHKLKRRALAVEIDPATCDVALDRWIQWQRSEPILESDGRPLSDVARERQSERPTTSRSAS